MCLKSNTTKSQLLLLLCLKIYMILAASNPPQSRTMKQCGLPPNLEELPDFAQDEIRAVWKDYVAGRKCDKEMLITEDILAVLAMFDKELERQGMKMSRGERGKGLDRVGLIGIGTPELGMIGTSTRAPEAVQTVLVRRGGEEAEEEDRSTGKEVERHSTTTSTSPSTSYTPTPSFPPASSTDAPVPPPTPFGPPTLPKEPRQIVAAAATVETSYQTNPREQPPIGRPGKVPQQAELAESGENEEAGGLEDGQEVIRPIKQKILHEYEDRVEPEEPADEKEPVQQLFEPASQLPFLRGAKTAVVNVFRQVLEDPKIPSETRRMEEIHVLAVSYLNPRQLVKFNAWSTERRKKIHLREHQLSRPGREALERLARATDERQRRLELRTMPAELRGELHGFAMDKRRRESGNGIGTGQEKKQQ